MDNLKKSLGEKIEKNRPNIKPSSIKTYISCLSNLVKKMDGKLDIDFFNNTKEILKYLEEKTSVQRKTCLSALYILTKNEEYQKPMLEDIKTVNNEYKEQKKNVKETENWISEDDLTAIYNTYFKIANDIFKKKDWTSHDITELQRFFILVFLGGYFFPPRRSQDFTELKVKDYNKDTDNFYCKGMLYFNIYKTSKSYGEQNIKLPDDIDKMVKKYIKKIDNQYFFFNPKTGNKFTSPNITLLINGIFGKKVSTNMLRHVYLSNKYKDVPALLEMEETAKAMGHNLNVALEMYVKH
jgi:hypothetical protein